MSTGGDFWGSRPIPDIRMTAVTLSARMHGIVGTTPVILTRPDGMRYLAMQVHVDGFFLKVGRYSDRTFADADVTVGDDTIDDTTHGFTSGDGPYQLTTSGVVPAGLALLTDYFVGVVDADTYTLHTSHNDATKGQNPVDITAAAGGGTHNIATMSSAIPAATNTDGQESVNLVTEKKLTAGAIIAMPATLTIEGSAAGSALTYWFLP